MSITPTNKILTTQATQADTSAQTAPKPSDEKTEAVREKTIATSTQEASTGVETREVEVLTSRPEMVSIETQTEDIPTEEAQPAPAPTAENEAEETEMDTAARLHAELIRSVGRVTPLKLAVMVAAKAIFDVLSSEQTKKFVMDALIAKSRR